MRLVERSARINTIVRQSFTIAADRSLSDAAKAKAMRRHSLALFGHFASITVGLAVAVGLPIFLVWLLAFARLWSFEGALEATLSWPFLIAGLLAFLPAIMRSERRHEG